MNVDANLKALGLELPQAAAPVANYVPYVISGNQVFISGQVPVRDGALVNPGTVGDDVTVEQAKEAAQVCALNILAQLYDAIGGDWSKVVRCVKLGGFVNAVQGFKDQPQVINGASNLMVDALGEAGKHARFAVGASSLPRGVSVEVDAIFEIQ